MLPLFEFVLLRVPHINVPDLCNAKILIAVLGGPGANQEKRYAITIKPKAINANLLDLRSWVIAFSVAV